MSGPRGSDSTLEFRLTIKCDGAAFHDDDGEPVPEYEIASILRRLAKQLEAGEDFSAGRIVRDGNGNTVGQATLGTRNGEKRGAQ